MLGQNPKRPVVSGNGQTLEVKSIFATLQGEGLYTGWPAVFIRLGGCNLSCHFCDTSFEEFYTATLDDVMANVQALANNSQGRRIRNLVVVTGGEPLRQPIEALCHALLGSGFKVQIETNGTLFRDLPSEVDIVCSPKLSQADYAPLRQDLLPRVSALKFIVSASDLRYNRVSEVGQAQHDIPVYVQPMDEYDEAKNRANIKLATDLATQHGYRLSLQTHKIVGIE